MGEEKHRLFRPKWMLDSRIKPIFSFLPVPPETSAGQEPLSVMRCRHKGDRERSRANKVGGSDWE